MIYLWITLFVIAIILFWLLNVVGLPGNWFAAGLIALWMWLGPSSVPLQIGWPILASILVLAGFGELIEFAAGMIGAKQVGGTKRGAWLALLGSMIGGLFGAIVGIPIPIPIVGFVVSSLLFACIGALLGAMVGEKWAGKPMSESMQVGGMAFVGRFFGTAAKIVVGSVISVVSILGLCF